MFLISYTIKIAIVQNRFLRILTQYKRDLARKKNGALSMTV